MHMCVLCDAKVCSLFTGEQGFMAAVLGCPLSGVVERCVCVCVFVFVSASTK